MKKLRLTTRSEPIILMEVMPAAMVVSLLLLTYLFFAAGVGLIVRHNLVGTSTLSAKEDEAPGGGCRSNFTHNPDPAIPSAFGCTEFYPDIFSTPLLAPPSEEEEEDLAAGTKYGAVFSGDFAGMKKLYGSVSLHASFANATTLESLPDPAVVDLTLEACTEGPEEGGESGVCEEGWAPVLSQVWFECRVGEREIAARFILFFATSVEKLVGAGGGYPYSYARVFHVLSLIYLVSSLIVFSCPYPPLVSHRVPSPPPPSPHTLYIVLRCFYSLYRRHPASTPCSNSWLSFFDPSLLNPFPRSFLFCGLLFAGGGRGGVAVKRRSQTDISVRIRNLPMDRGYTIFNFFQNQETMRGQPLIKQYRLQVRKARHPHILNTTHTRTHR